MGPGFPGATPPKQGPPTGLIIVGLAVVVALVGVMAYALWPARSDEEQIRDTLTSIKTNADLRAHSCANDVKFYDQFSLGTDNSSGDSPLAGMDARITKDEIGDIQVHGDTAVAVPKNQAGHGLRLRKEGGQWKVCLTDDPIFANLMKGMYN
jgi:hypothetical protein